MHQIRKRSTPKRSIAVGICLAGILTTSSAQAAVTISSQPTQNMTCTNGVCAPTAASAILNTGDLENDLAAGNVTVTTTGAGVEAGNVNVKSPLSWATTNSLSLAAHRSITIYAPVSVVGQGGLAIQTGGKNGTLSFGTRGSVGFSNLSSALTINAVAYTLVGNIKTLAADIVSSPAGAYALAGSYDASADGTYKSSPIGTSFTGTFEGLGNTFMNLSVSGATAVKGQDAMEGLFAEIDTNGAARDIGLVNATFSLPHNTQGGPLAGVSSGTIRNCYATGTVTGPAGRQYFSAIIGGLVGVNYGTIAHSYATATVNGFQGVVGGLVALNSGTVSQSYATGDVSGLAVGGLVDENGGTVMGSYATGKVRVMPAQGYEGLGGGLVGSARTGTIANSYATGAVNGAAVALIGGLVGGNGGSVSFSYSTGAVTGHTGSTIGGLIGGDGAPPGSITDTDWNTTTSHITNLSQGAGTPANDPGITGLSTAQLQSGLPTGFDPKIWAESANINGGLPYLIANPPAK